MRTRSTSSATAMTDIAFLLLLFFLIFAITSMTLPVPVDPATSEHSFPTTGEEVRLIVDAQGTLYLSGKPIAIEDIPSSPIVSLLADKATFFSNIAPVIDRLRENGTKTIRCIVQERP